MAVFGAGLAGKLKAEKAAKESYMTSGPSIADDLNASTPVLAASPSGAAALPRRSSIDTAAPRVDPTKPPPKPARAPGRSGSATAEMMKPGVDRAVQLHARAATIAMTNAAAASHAAALAAGGARLEPPIPTVLAGVAEPTGELHFRQGMRLSSFSAANAEETDARSNLVVAESLAAYLPLSVIRYCFTAEAGLSWKPRTESFLGSVVFCDIAGFTPLTERYAREGPDGAEKLVRFLNKYFGTIIDIVHDHGGDVILFAGDALIAMWGSADGQRARASHSDRDILRETAFAAVKCASIIDATMNTNASAQQPRLHMGVGTGMLHFMQIGGTADHWTYLLCGEPLAQIALGGSLSSDGTVVSPEVWDLIEPMFDGGAVQIKEAAAGLADQAGGFVQIHALKDVYATARTMAPAVGLGSFTARVTGALRLFIPKVIQMNTKPGEESQVAELRRLAIVFMSIKNVELKTAESLGRAHDVVATVQRSFYRYGGVINKILLDDKGFIILAGFGLPPFAHENDPERAVLASMLALDELRLLGVSCAMGITTGEVFCGIVGSKARREYTVIGDAVNTAARLMTFRPEGIMMDRQTVSAVYATSHSIRFAQIGSKKFKGKAAEMEIWEPCTVMRNGLKSLELIAETNVPLVGRMREILMACRGLRGLKENAADALTRLIFEGEAGSGKSRMCEEIVRYAATFGVAVLEGSGDEIAKASQFLPWISVLQTILGGSDASPEMALRVCLDAFAGMSDLTDYVAILTELCPQLALAEPAEVAEIKGVARLERQSRMIAQLLRYVCSFQATVLILENVNYFDSSSRKLLVEIAASDIPGLGMVITTRPFGHVPQFYGQLKEIKKTTVMTLDPLPPSAIKNIVSSRMSVTELPAVVEEVIIQKCGGSPFFAEQMIRYMKNEGLIRIENEYCVLPVGVDSARIRNLGVPGTLKGFILARVDSLSPEEAVLLKVASVIGMEMDLDVLLAMHPARAAHPDELGHRIAASLENMGQFLVRVDNRPPGEGDDVVPNNGSLAALTAAFAATPLIERYSSPIGAYGLGLVSTPALQELCRRRYRFRNRIMRDVAYDLLPFKERTLFHAELSFSLERVPAVIQALPELALYHCRCGNIANKAVRHAEIIVAKASKDLAAAYAVRLSLARMDMSQLPLQQRCALKRKLAESAFALGQEDEACALLLATLEALSVPVPPPGTLFPELLWATLDAEQASRQAADAVVRMNQSTGAVATRRVPSGGVK